MPDNSTEVSLLIPALGNPYDAMQEWFFFRRKKEIPPGSEFDVHLLLPFWNFGLSPKVKEETCGLLHTGVGRTTGWGPEIMEALEVWGNRRLSVIDAPYPPDLLAFLDPGASIPPITGPHRVPPRNRHVYMAIDLTAPLEKQFAESLKLAQAIRTQVLELIGEKSSRPGKSETRRDVLIFTLKYAGKLTVPAIAKRVFPKETLEHSQKKVKRILRSIRLAMRGGSPKHPA